jgi:hypothetical protein
VDDRDRRDRYGAATVNPAAELRAALAAAGILHLALKVQPRSPRSAWAGRLEDGSWKVKLAAAPERGQANDELIRFLAAELQVERAKVEITAGATHSRKQVRVRE